MELIRYAIFHMDKICDSNGYDSDNWEEGTFYDTVEKAEQELETYDSPEICKIYKVIITYIKEADKV